MNIQTIKVTSEYIETLKEVKALIKKLEKFDILGCDFEAATKYTDTQREILETAATSDKYGFFEHVAATAALQATALDHPAHVKVTHFSVAWSTSESAVVILSSDAVTELVMDWLVSTNIKQVWHNAGYDFRLIYYATGKVPKNYEDSQIFAKTVLNHVENAKSGTGLKDLAGSVYGNWGLDDESMFSLEHMYDEKLLKYAGIDSCATLWVWGQLVKHYQEPDAVYPDTTEDYTPWSQLPATNPMEATYPEAHFYHYTAKWLIRDTVRIMMNGLPISMEKVKELEDKLDGILADIDNAIHSNPVVQRFLDRSYEQMLEEYNSIQRSKMKTPKDFLVPFNSKNAVHRCFFMDEFASGVGISLPEEKLADGCSKWPVKTIKYFESRYPPLAKLLAHELSDSNRTVQSAMHTLAKAKAEKHNQKYIDKIAADALEKPRFNPASSRDKRNIFSFLGYESDEVSSKTGLDSWDREQIEQLSKSLSDVDEAAFTQRLIDHSFAAIVRNNFVASFYRYSLEGVLYGTYNLLGTKTGRFTSKSPNMLNAPSSRSIFSKPVKECFIAPEGFVVGGIDYSALT